MKDRTYCKWLLDQDWFKQNYKLLYNKIHNHKPLSFFTKNIDKHSNFIESYTFFNLIVPSNITIDLNAEEKKCYEYYFTVIEKLKQKILDRQIDHESNIYDIKYPKNWLIDFEKNYNISRDVLKTFLNSNDLPNITLIIEDIKKEGNITYLGGKTFNIAKERSKTQELWWEKILTNRYGERISVQFKYNNCFFDFLNINTNTIYECKLGFKDFNEDQYKKYQLILKNYNIIYLISTDCIIHLKQKIIVTSNKLYEAQISTKLNVNFYNILQSCKFILLSNSDDLLKYI